MEFELYIINNTTNETLLQDVFVMDSITNCETQLKFLNSYEAEANIYKICIINQRLEYLVFETFIDSVSQLNLIKKRIYKTIIDKIMSYEVSKPLYLA